MAITIIETPPKYNFVNNEIRYILQTSNVNLPGIAIDVLLHYQHVGGTPYWFPQFTVYPDKDGKVVLKLDSYLYSVVKHQLPPPGVGQQDLVASKQSCLFWIKYKETSDSDKTGSFDSTENNAKYALVGGVEQMKFSGGNFFNSYFPNNKPFMTWSHSNGSQSSKLRKFVFPDQEWFLTFFNYGNASAYQVEVTATAIDGVTTMTGKYGVTSTNGNLFFHIPCGIHQLKLDQWATSNNTKIFWYELTVKTPGGSTMTGTYRVYVDYNVYYRHWDFIYFNSLGGLDSVRLRGDFEKTYDITADEIQTISYNQIFNAYDPKSQLRTTAPVRRDSYKGDIGFAHNRYDQETLIELAMSRGIYENVGGRWIRVINLKKSNTLGLTRDTKKSFQLEWQYAYEETVYTPTWIDLGAGGVDVNVPAVPTCIAAALSGFTGLPSAKEGELYKFDIKLSGTKPFNFDNINKPDWLSWSIVNGDTIHIEGTPVITGSSSVVTLSFDYSNCNPTIKHFSETISIIGDQLNLPVRWGRRDEVTGNAAANYLDREINGVPGAIVMLQLTDKQVTNPTGKFIVNAMQINIGSVVTLKLDANGVSMVYCTVSGDPNAPGTVAIGILTIVYTSVGVIDPDNKNFTISKVF